MQAQNQINCHQCTDVLGADALCTVALGCSQILFVKILFFIVGLVFSFSAISAEYRSVLPAKVVMYDAPSKEASKLYILDSGYPVEIIVILGDWLKVRDQLGGLSWVESKSLSTKRMALVIVKTEIKAAEDTNAPMLATVEKDVVLELLAPQIKNGWVKVKHRDGIEGFVHTVNLWGVN